MSEDINADQKRALLEALGEFDQADVQGLDPDGTNSLEHDKDLNELKEIAGQIRGAVEFDKVKDNPIPEGAMDMLRAAWGGGANDFKDSRLDDDEPGLDSRSGAGEPGNVVQFQAWRRVLSAVAACAALVLIGVFYFRGEGIDVQGPKGEIASLTPMIEWENDSDPDKMYDVWIISSKGNHLDKNETPTMFIAKGVRSPIAFADLKPGPAAPAADSLTEGDYRLLVCHAGEGRASGTPVKFTVRRTE